MKVFRLNSNFYKWYINYISATYIYTSFRRTLLILYRTYIDRLTCYLNSTQRLLILHRSLSRRSISTLYINSLKKKKKKKNRWTEKEKNRHSQHELWQTAYWSLRQSERQDLAAQSFPFLTAKISSWTSIMLLLHSRSFFKLRVEVACIHWH